jgi:1-acyl-sn-glycerol-3-phosphate acyltransferase
MTMSDASTTAPRSAPPLPVRDRWSLKAVARVATIGLAALPLLPLQMLIVRFRPDRSEVIPQLFHRIVCRVASVRTVVEGVPPPPGSHGLIVANHVSWLDIPVLGAQLPLSFIAKSEVAGWPGIGLLARLQDTIFIDRSRRSATAETAAAMGHRLRAGDCVALFAEGTTGDGSRILPFRSSLLGAVKEALGPEGEGEIMVYPLAILHLGRHGIPGGRAGRSLLAWYGDMSLGPHLRSILGGGPIDVRLVWGEPIAMGRAHSRKETAKLAERSVRAAALAHFSGRDRTALAPLDLSAPEPGGIEAEPDRA